MNNDLWKQGKPAKEFPQDWIVVPVMVAIEHEQETVEGFNLLKLKGRLFHE